DMNNTQFSGVYRKIKGNFRDSFQEKGFGFGSTFHLRFLPFRIDYVLADSRIEVMAHRNYDVVLSDHLPVMASFRFTEDK
ncbi:MAG: endonuclease/exonuclease/phosphatase family protein, partial [Bacteroidota bacterium]